MTGRVQISEAGARMIPAGYMYKSIQPRPNYVTAANVMDIYSVGECGAEFSPNFCDYGKYFKQNGFGYFNDPQTMHELAAQESVDLSGMTLFYYEIYELECDFVGRLKSDLHWIPTRYNSLFSIDVLIPQHKRLVGYDALLAANVELPDCSLLSCSNLAANFSVNRHCLFDSFDEAKAAISSGIFHDCEQCPQRLMAVYLVDT